MRDVQDHYFHEAKREGYLSRAAYKLIEIDDRRKVLQRGDRVLDCGAAPGSWLQVAAGRVGPSGVVVGIDPQPIRFRAANVKTMEADFTQTQAHALLALANAQGANAAAPVRLFDVILSDMAPNTTGDPGGDHFRSVRLCEALLDRCGELLRPKGALVMKVFEGEQYPALMKRMESMFEAAKGFKPKASRGESREMYIIGLGHHPSPARSDARSAAPPRRRPSAGWAQA